MIAYRSQHGKLGDVANLSAKYLGSIPSQFFSSVLLRMKNHHNRDDNEYIFILAVTIKRALKITDPYMCENSNLQTSSVSKAEWHESYFSNGTAGFQNAQKFNYNFVCLPQLLNA
jgi:hypothetical protein